MTIQEYQTLTGTTVSAANTAKVTAALARTQSILETMLGFTLTPADANENLYNERGKTSLECACPNVDIDNLDDLQPPDAVVFAYRLYPYNHKDKSFHVDPFTTLNKVKLVTNVIVPSGDPGVTIKDFDEGEVRSLFGRDGWAKYIEHCESCLCTCDCTDCVQLAVDADWLWFTGTDVPLDLQYVWADMVTYYSNRKRGIKSESITTHSYTKFDKDLPEYQADNMAVIKRYAGPYGSVTRTPTV